AGYPTQAPASGAPHGQAAPYGQVPGAGTTYGQSPASTPTAPGQAPQPGQPTYPGTPGPQEQPGQFRFMTPEPTRKRLGKGAVAGIVIGAILVLALCVAGSIAGLGALGGDNLEQGTCITRKKVDGGDQAVSVDCSTPGAYEILKRVEGTKSDQSCPADTTYAFINYNDNYVLCLREK
ncbi:MAG TPA: hypothetical protein VGR21_00945, partial [Cryptosporangiaceae bacterium]|nr:hypothetical protein [Cryptosporangiaceae bacterium]